MKLRQLVILIYFTDGLTIYTTLDTNAQIYVDKILNTNDVIKLS